MYLYIYIKYLYIITIIHTYTYIYFFNRITCLTFHSNSYNVGLLQLNHALTHNCV